MAFCLGGLISTATPSVAAEIDRPTSILSSLNVPLAAMVPDLGTPETSAFASLDEAVAAHGSAADGDADTLRCLATTIFFESKGEPLAGQLAVAEVVLNRARSGRFAPDVCGVVKQRGQFSFVRGGVLPAIDEARRDYRTAMAVAKVALADAWASPAPRALFFNGRRVGLPGRLTRVALIGNHIFYR